MVYVLNKFGKPLMPCKESKARKLLKNKKARIVNRMPFTIQLVFGSYGRKDEITLGVDTGSSFIGLSATTKSKVLFEAEVQQRTDIVRLIADRRALRGKRRSRKLRYRKTRYNNRSIPKGWLNPSIRQKIGVHLTMISKVYAILPISKLIVELAIFDIQKIVNPSISGRDYQNGPQKDYWNTREYILWRDNYTCQNCNGNSGDAKLNVHHIESRKTGGNSPSNLITLCETCHRRYHKGEIELCSRIHRSKSMRDASYMNIMKNSLQVAIESKFDNVEYTFGYETKRKRLFKGLCKTHYIDARCISGNLDAKSEGVYYHYKKVRRHNRQLHRATFDKGGTRKVAQLPYKVFGYLLYDVVRYNNKDYYIVGRRSAGCFDLRLVGSFERPIRKSYKKLRFLYHSTNFIINRFRIHYDEL